MWKLVSFDIGKARFENFFVVCFGQLAPFDPTKKKKKKKVVIQESADDAVDKLAENTENLSGVGFVLG